jgi:hypothetical protein
LEGHEKALEWWAAHNIDPKPAYEPGDPCWESAELVAAGRYRMACLVLERAKSIRARFFRARAYGVTGDAEAVLAEWAAIARLKSPVYIDGADWFYLPQSLWDEPRFWRAVLEMAHRVHSLGLHIDKQAESVGALDNRERTTTFAEFQLARIGRNKNALERFVARHPDWSEAKSALRLLSRN